jgi:hypothetical protein
MSERLTRKDARRLVRQINNSLAIIKSCKAVLYGETKDDKRERKLAYNREYSRNYKQVHPDTSKACMKRWRESKDKEWLREYNRQKKRESRARRATIQSPSTPSSEGTTE